jgi:hypothetical protein
MAGFLMVEYGRKVALVHWLMAGVAEVKVADLTCLRLAS